MDRSHAFPDIDPEIHADEVEACVRLLCSGLHPRLVTVAGELGSGKSTVLARVAEALAARDHAVRYVWSAPDIPTAAPAHAELWVVDDLHAVAAPELPAFVAALAGALSARAGLRIVAGVDEAHRDVVQPLIDRFSVPVELTPIPDAVSAAFADQRMGGGSRTVRDHRVRAAGGNIALLAQVVSEFSPDGEAEVLDAPVSRIPSRYDHLAREFLQMPRLRQEALAAVAVRGVPVLADADQGLTDTLQALVAAPEPFLRVDGIDSVAFVSQVHRAVVLRHSSAAQRRDAHAAAALDPALSASDRELHAGCAADSDGVAHFDAALRLGVREADRILIMCAAQARETSAPRRRERALEIARSAVLAGDLPLARRMLASMAPADIDEPGVADVVRTVSHLRHGCEPGPGIASDSDLLAVLASDLRRLREATSDPGAPTPASALVAALRDSGELVATGEWADAAELLEWIALEAARADAGFVSSVALARLALVDALRGRVTRAAERVRSATGDSRVARHPLVRAAVWQAQLHAAVAAGRMQEALVLIHSAADPLRAMPWSPYPTGLLMDLADVVGDDEVELPLRLPLTASDGVPSFAAAYVEALADPESRSERLALLAQGSHPSATPFESARARLAIGEDLAHRHEGSQARAHLLAAAGQFDDIGAVGWRDRARRSAEAASGRTPAPLFEASGVPVTPLTFQEERVVMLAATGLSNKEISRRLYLSPRTVGGHLYNAYPKLGVTTRAALRDALMHREAMTGVRRDPVS